jgi:hypothetical protein
VTAESERTFAREEDQVTPGEAFARAIAAKDADTLKKVLCTGLDFKALTPGRFWEADSVDEIVDEVILGSWFASSDEIEELESIETSSVAERDRVAYRLRVRNPDGIFLVEQQAYYDTDGEKIRWLRILCAGYQPVS